MSQQTSSWSLGSVAKTGAYIGAGAYLVTHLIPMSGYKNVLDWMHSSVMSLLNVTPNKIAGSPENLTGAAIYVLGWGVFAGLGAVVGALLGGRALDGRAPAESPAESAVSSDPPNREREARPARVLSADEEVAADTTSPAIDKASVGTESSASPTSSQLVKEAEPLSTPLAEALGAGAVGGAAAGLAAHYLAGGKLTFPIFIVVYVLMLSQLKGSGKLTGLVSFVIVGSLVLAIMKYLAG